MLNQKDVNFNSQISKKNHNHEIENSYQISDLDNLEEELYAQATDLFNEEKIEEAKMIFDYLVDVDPEDDHYWFMLGICSYSLDEYVDAIMDFNKSIFINPENQDAFFFKAWSLYLCEQYEDALDNAMRSYELNQDSDSLFLETLILYDLNEFQNAIRLLDILLDTIEEDNSLYKDVLFKKSACLVAIREYDSALKNLDLAIAINPNDIQLINFRGVILDLLGQYDDALEYFEKAIKMDKSYPIPHLNKAKIFFNKEEFENSLKLINKVILMDNELDEAWYYKSLTHFMLSDNNNAMDSIDMALDLNFNKSEYFLLKSQILDDLGLTEESKNYKRMIEGESNHFFLFD